MAAKVFKFGFTPDYGSSGWDNLKLAILVRHRVTHPKSDGVMEVSDGELDKIRDAAQWFADTCSQCMAAISHAFDGAKKQFAELVAALPPEMAAYVAMREAQGGV